MHKKQRGITLIGWIFLLVPLALVVYCAIRLTPIYLNYSRVVRSLDQIAADSKADDSVSVRTLQTAIAKRLDVEGISFPELGSFVIHRDGQSWVIDVGYEETAPLVSNVSLLVTFKKTVRIGKAPD